ncbi:MAG: TVP38/TMEM64 family protein [Synergistaceae bacterium]|nr:TVP38/TMEM64 family protein [Synergistaceae bacterium]
MAYRSKIIKPLIFFILIFALIILNKYYGWADSFMEVLPELKALVAASKFKAALIYVIATALGCVLLALPGAAFAVLAGLIFDPVTGTLLCLVAATLGAVLAFLAARYFIKDAVRPWLEKNYLLKKFLFDDVNKSGVILLMITRLVPLFPYNLQNFAYGLTDIKLWPYTLYTFIFMTPGAAAFVVGASGIGSPEHRILYFAIASALIIIVMAIGYVLRRRFVIK